MIFDTLSFSVTLFVIAFSVAVIVLSTQDSTPKKHKDKQRD